MLAGARSGNGLSDCRIGAHSGMDINDLPDFPAIQQIQSALWRTGETRGAAVMVGAGFSRNADLAAGNSRQPPLWTDFYTAMETRLYPEGGAPDDPLRLAEEYKAALGEPALEGLLFDLVRDTEWLPGLVHRKLLSLPWADVLTTNWDTLLERAAAVNISQTYDNVRAVADIPRTRAPRIVKLHGSMPSNRPFIFTEEDYRTYPTIFAPFVNLAQQVLLENELCLVGFSGDDPNFLQWSGWVRDQLGASARRIHLVGVLRLSPSRRKFLEARNVSPIDLAPLVDAVDKHAKHRVASEQFLDFLLKSKPRPIHEWSLASDRDSSEWTNKPIEQQRDPAVGAHHLKEMSKRWKEERQSYPGWFVCPSQYRYRIRYGTDLGIAFKAAFDQIAESERGAVIYEIAWRFDIAFWPLQALLAEVIARAAENAKTLGLDGRQRCHLGLVLLRSAREKRNATDFGRWRAFLEAEADGDEDILAAIQYEQCLWARDHLDFSNLSNFLKNVRGQDPAWKIRRAALHCELGEMEAADVDIRDALRDIRDRHARDRKSIWVLSRLAWAMFLAQALNYLTKASKDTDDPLAEPDKWPPIFSEAKCDPWDELHYLDRELEEAFRKKAKDAVTKEPKFDPGTYVDHSGGTRFVSPSVVSPAYEITRLADLIALPIKGDHVDIMGNRLRRAIDLLDTHDEDGLLTCIRVLHSHTDDLVEKRFGRIQIARMPYEIAGRLVDRLWRSVEFGSYLFRHKDKDGQERFDTFWIERVRTHLELLSRLVVRLPESKAAEAFSRGVSFAKDSRWEHWWLFESLGHLLERSLAGVSLQNRKHLLLDVLNFPLPEERAIKGMENHWPELIESLGSRSIVRPSDDTAFRERVAGLTEKVRSSAAFSRERAALRLIHLNEAGALNAEEIKKFGEALWSRRRSENGFPSDTNLLPHVFLAVPGPDPEVATQLFRTEILSHLTKQRITAENLIALVGATRTPRVGSRSFQITRDEANALFDAILAWQPEKTHFDFGDVHHRNREIGKAIGPVLANTVLPLLDRATVGGERIDKLFMLIEQGFAPSAISALPEVSRLDPSRLAQVVRVIHRGLLSSEGETAFFAFDAIHRWRTRERDGKLQGCPAALIQDVVAIAVTLREPGLIHALYLVTDLVSDGNLSKEDQSRVADTLETMRHETDYSHWDTKDPRTTTITLVRARCVRLADKLRAAGVVHPAITAWIDDAKIDPMPEVRYALLEMES